MLEKRTAAAKGLATRSAHSTAEIRRAKMRLLMVGSNGPTLSLTECLTQAEVLVVKVVGKRRSLL